MDEDDQRRPNRLGSNLTVKKSFNPDVIKSVLFEPQIWDCIAEDGQVQSHFMVDFNVNCFLTLTTEAGELAGLYILHPHNGATLIIHAHVLPSFREKYAFISGQAILKYIKESMPPKYQKIIAFIPEIYPNVYHFTRKHGFKDEGLLTKAYRKNNKLHDIHLLGMMRADI